MAEGGADPLTSLNCGSLHLGRAQEIMDLNAALATWRGLPRDALVGADLDMLFRRGSWLYWDATVEPVLEQQGHAWDLAMRLRSERGPPVEVLVNARRDEHATRCILFPFSGRLLWERRLLAVQEQARRQRAEIERLEKIERFRREFINAVAHELKTPLTPIRLGIHVLQDHLGTSAQPRLLRSLEIIRANLDRLAKLNESIIRSADVAAGRVDMTIQPIEVGRFIRDAVHQWRQRHPRSRPVGLDIQDAVISADHQALTTCLENLLDNAVKFSPPHAQIKVRALAGPPVRIIIEDQGRGIEPDRLQELGRPFAQAHDRAQVTTLGMGLGLHIVTQLMYTQGGRFEIQSEGLGRGTRAILQFPCGEGSGGTGRPVHRTETDPRS